MSEKKKRTIQEIVDSKKTGEKMVYSSVPDYTSASWALEVVIVAGPFFCIQSISHSIWCWSGSLIFNFLSNKNLIRQIIVTILATLTIGTVVYSNFFI